MEVTNIMGIIFVLVTIGYFIPLCFYFFKNSRPKMMGTTTRYFCFSIVIAFRNEAENLSALLNSIKKLDYPPGNFELIFVNDHSADMGSNLITNELNGSRSRFTIFELPLGVKGKKAALSMGFYHAQFEHVITLDSDCIVQPAFLKVYNAFVQKHSSLSMVGGEVAFLKGKGFLNAFQSLDLAAMVSFSSLTMQFGHPTLVNGANLCIRKKDFVESGGYGSHEHLVSGDDVFLLHDFKRQGKELYFLNNPGTVVYTRPSKNWREFKQQRIRWAKKSVHYKDLFTKGISIWLLLVQILSIITLIFLFSSNEQNRQLAAILLIAKVLSESLFLFPHLKRIGRLKLYSLVLPFQLLYPIYIVGITILAQTSPYSWKGRNYT